MFNWKPWHLVICLTLAIVLSYVAIRFIASDSMFTSPKALCLVVVKDGTSKTYWFSDADSMQAVINAIDMSTYESKFKQKNP